MDSWRPGLAVAAVCGHRFDVIDVDPRHGGEPSLYGMQEAGLMPRTFGLDRTPQGGVHYYIAPLGVGSRDKIMPGVDMKGGRPDGSSRGLAFIAPTERKGGTYTWGQFVDFDALAEGDETGEALADYVRALKFNDGSKSDPAPVYIGPAPVGREAAYLNKVLSNLVEQIAATPEGGRNSALFNAAMKVGSFAAGAGLDVERARLSLTNAAESAGLGNAEIKRTWRSGASIGASHPRAVPPPAKRTEATSALPEHRVLPSTPGSGIEPSPPLTSEQRDHVAPLLRGT